jgi:hypothetical protein
MAGLSREGVDVRGHHHLDETVKIGLGLPAQHLVRLRRVADEQVDVRRRMNFGSTTTKSS